MIKRLFAGLLLSLVMPLQADVLIDIVLSNQLQYPEREFRAIGRERLRAIITPEARAQLFPIITPDEGESQSGDDPPAGWTAVEIEAAVPTHALNSTVLDYDTGTTTFTASSNGGWIFGNDDSFGGWAFQVPVSGDFTLTARVVTASTEVVLSKGGIMFRESLTAGSEHCLLSVFYTSSTLVDCRLTTDGTTSTEYFDGIAPVVPDCVRFEYDSAIPSYKLFAKTDATDCATGAYTELYQNTLDFDWTGYVLLATTPSDDNDLGKNATTTFDQVVTSTAAVDHSPGDVQFNPTAYPVNEDAGTVTLTVTRLGDGAGACSLNYVVNDGSAIAGTHYTDESGTVSWIDGDTMNKTIQIAVTDIPGTAQGDRQFTAVLTVATCPDTLNDATATVTIADLDAGASWTPMGPCNSVIDGLCGYGLDWTALVDPPSETVYVRNLETSGTDSVDAALSNCTPGTVRFVIPTLSGVAEFPQDTNKVPRCDNLVWVGSYAPGQGFHVKGLQVRPQGNRQLWIGWSCFSDATAQNTGRCFDITQGTSTSDSIVLLNVAGAFACDGAYDIWDDSDNISILHSMAVYPQNLAGCSFLPQSMLLGNQSGSSTNFTIARNIMAHAEHRSPSWAEADGSIINNVVLNQEVRWTTIDHINTLGVDVNIEGNLYIYGADSNTAINPIQFAAFDDGVDVDVDVCVEGNEAVGITYSTQADLIDDFSGGDIGVVPCPAVAHSTGVTVTTIADKELFAVLVAKDAGPRPGVNRLPLYQQVADQVVAAAGGGNSGTVINTPADIGGYPTVAVETCDPTLAGDCGANVPAWPETGTYAQKWAAVNAARCARQRAGAPGC